MAANLGDIDIIALLLEYGIDPNCDFPRHLYSRTFVSYCILYQ